MRPLGALLAVTERDTGARRYACRPSLPPVAPGIPCFARVVRPLPIDEIALAVDAPRVEHHREHAAGRGADLAAYLMTSAQGGQVPA